MYFSPKKHILSNVILYVTVIRFVGFCLSGLARVAVRSGGVQLMYEVFSEVYRHFVLDLYQAVVKYTGVTSDTYTSLYNLSHSFKYQGMLIALLLGVIMTAIFLDDKTLMLVTILAASIYLLSATGLEMMTLSVLGESVGIVWSSVIFHLIDTIGMIGLALYLRIKYHGV